MDWEHAQADSIEQLEYRGIRANTKRKGKQSYKRETRIEP
jgi:stalled ribosome alternative rescue factor ArfA